MVHVLVVFVTQSTERLFTTHSCLEQCHCLENCLPELWIVIVVHKLEDFQLRDCLCSCVICFGVVAISHAINN